MKTAMAVIQMVNISKSFPGVVANDRVNLTLHKGEIHALLGENGAGKSTLMSILTGLYRPDAGEIIINGQKVDFRSPKQAVANGIGMVHQHFKLVKPFTVAENILLGLSDVREVYDMSTIESGIADFCAQYGLGIDLKAKVWQLSIGQQQKAEIVKTLYYGAEVLILDEPTAVLTPQEADALYHTLRTMADKGKTIVVISHKLREVLEHTDRITVLRGGRSINTVASQTTNEQELTGMMVGRPVMLTVDKKPVSCGKTVLELSNVSARGNRGEIVLNNVCLDIHEGEVLGIAGVAGNGQLELAEVIAGMRPLESGGKMVDGKEYTMAGPKQMIEAGLGYVPEDRLGTGLVPNLSAVENTILKTYRAFTGWWINWGQAKAEAERLVTKFDIKMAHTDYPVKMLSGGNLQKLLIAREIAAGPRLVVAVYPMRGLDVAAMEAVRSLLLNLRDTGKAVMLISEELDELFALSDRIAVLNGGQIMGVIRPETATVEMVGMMMAGKELAV